MRHLLTVLIFLVSPPALAQSGYTMNFKIKGWHDTTTYLGYYYGESKALKDTAKVNHKGEFTFSGKNSLPQGVYFLILDKTLIFEFVVGADQEFEMETDASDYVRTMKVKGDEDNKVFFDIMGRRMEAEPFMKILQDTTLKDEARKKEAQESFKKITEKVIAYQLEVIHEQPTSVTARIFKATLPIDVPEAPKKADGTIDSSFRFRYYRAHYFDNFDLSDDALIRMPRPFYQEKVKDYLEKLFIPQADTITRAINNLVAKAKKNPETYKYLVYTCIYLYQTPEIMGLDAVYVNLYNTYFKTGEMDFWANAQLKKNLKDYADKLSRAMIGQQGPNLMMQDQFLAPKSLYDIKKKYTLVYFFDPDCGHCRQESPKLVDFYNKNKSKYDLEVFAVCMDTSLQKMKDYIKEMKMSWITVNGPRSYLAEPFRKLYYSETTPTLYILDEKKTVIARKLPVEKVDEFLTNYEKFQKSKAPAGGKGT
jgi:thiol-disulfide isomerase/thioredoxin